MEWSKFIKAEPFMRYYLPDIKNVKYKLTGSNSNGNPLDFSPQEKKQIKAAIKQMVKEIDDL